MPKKKVVVVGAGPVGTLAALYAARRGFEVEVYELRGDMREEDTAAPNLTKSINLALSERGIHALRSLNHPQLLDTVLSETIPMHGRMVHTRSPTGDLREQSQAYDVHGRYQRSIDRGGLNKVLLNELDKTPNVKLYFQHKLTGADFDKKKAWFEVRSREPSRKRYPETEVNFDLMIGTDGAHSAARFHMMKFARMNYQQEYIDCLWCEFTMTPSTTADEPQFRISPNHLHIWPGGKFMFIALPSLDKSFVCTLFGPATIFHTLETSSSTEFVSFFDKHFPGVTSHISPAELITQFKSNPHLPLINIKCSPHHYSSSVVILGDSANAIVPFYGQGMNAGLESVRILFEKLDAHNRDVPPENQSPYSSSNTAKALQAYTAERVVDAHAIADLALANYIEMRESVVSPTYKLRKFVEETFDRYLPVLGWKTQYSRVSFGNDRYSHVIGRSKYQKRVLELGMVVLAVLVGVGVVGPTWTKWGGYVVSFWRRKRTLVWEGKK